MPFKKTLLSLLAAPALFMATPAQAVECVPEASKLEWYLCVTEAVPYKRGVKTETRQECVINQKLEVKDCNLGDLFSHLPANVDPKKFQEYHHAFIYAVGPLHQDAKKTLKMEDYLKKSFEFQQETGAPHCGTGQGLFEASFLTKFSDNFNLANYERTKVYLAKLAQEGKTIVTHLIVPGHFRKECSETTFKGGAVDKASFSKFLYYFESTYPKL